jgi:hypothetical protein
LDEDSACCVADAGEPGFVLGHVDVVHVWGRETRAIGTGIAVMEGNVGGHFLALGISGPDGGMGCLQARFSWRFAAWRWDSLGFME